MTVFGLQGVDMEAGHAPLPTFDGRPSVHAILKDILEYEQAPEVSVHSAGETPRHLPLGCVCISG